MHFEIKRFDVKVIHSAEKSNYLITFDQESDVVIEAVRLQVFEEFQFDSVQNYFGDFRLW